MRKDRLSFLLLGLGIGIILTNFVYYMVPNVEYRDLTDEEIVERAKELGMVFIKDAIEVNSSKDSVPTEAESEEIVFKIEKGETLEIISDNLYNAGLIDDKDRFINYAEEKGMARSFRTGTYYLTKGMDYETLLMTLTNKNN
ncbi:MAG TPA: endolytic transglycosylase MltG [Tissierellia bacterium]|nr:endolytic transglycosylase MltG [Tissierellia bacterium]